MAQDQKEGVKNHLLYLEVGQNHFELFQIGRAHV